MNWAKERAEKIADGRVGPVTKLALVEDIAAALQQVADECAEVCDDSEVLIPIAEWETKKRVSAATATGLADIIRARFPKEGP